MLDLKELRWKAENATPGPWRYDGMNYIFAGTKKTGDLMVAEIRGSSANLPMDDNAAFIAGFNPATVLALLDERKKLVRLLKAERDFQKLIDSEPKEVIYNEIDDAVQESKAALEACADIEVPND